MERKFATLYNKVRAVLNAAGFTEWLRIQLWAQAAHYLTELENILYDNSYVCPYQILNRKPRWVKDLRTFGEIGIVYDNQKIKSKLRNKGYPCIFIGYSNMHADKVYKFYNMQTNNVLLSRNVVWLNKMYSEWMNMKAPPLSSSNESYIIETMTPDIPPPALHMNNINDEMDDHMNVDHEENNEPVPPILLALEPVASVELFETLLLLTILILLNIWKLLILF